MTAFTGVQTHTDEFISERESLLEGFKGFVLGQMAQETQNQRRADAQLGLRIHTGAVQTGDDGAHGHLASSVGLWVEKDLGMNHVVCLGTLKVSPCHVIKILWLLQHAGTRVIDIQKALQVGEGVSGSQLVHALVTQSHIVALGQSKNQFGLQ